MTQFDVRQILSRRTLPPGFDPGKGIAALCGPRPASIKGLGKLPPRTVTFNSGGLSPGNTSGNCRLAINSDGFWSFSGHVHEAGIVGDKYVIALALLDLKDVSGATFVAYHTGNVSGQLLPGPSDDNFDGGPGDSGFDQHIIDQWDTVAHSRTRSTLHVATNVTDVTGLIGEALLIVGAVVFFTGGKTECDPLTVDASGNPQLTCRRTE
jgi:hypothetical protein